MAYFCTVFAPPLQFSHAIIQKKLHGVVQQKLLHGFNKFRTVDPTAHARRALTADMRPHTHTPRLCTPLRGSDCAFYPAAPALGQTYGTFATQECSIQQVDLNVQVAAYSSCSTTEVRQLRRYVNDNVQAAA